MFERSKWLLIRPPRLACLIVTLFLTLHGRGQQTPNSNPEPKAKTEEIIELRENVPATDDRLKSIALGTREQRPAIEVRGRIDADAIFVDQSARNKAIIGEVENATGFRRARLGAQGTVGDRTGWVAEVDFAGGKVSIKDMFVSVNDVPLLRRVRIGSMQVPFSLEGYTSPSFFDFNERSPIVSLDPAQKWGVGAFSYTDDERCTFSAMAYRSGTTSSGNDLSDPNDMAYMCRFTALPWYDDDPKAFRLMHLGAAVCQQYPFGNVVTIGQGPDSSLLPIVDDPSSPFVPTITVPASENQLYNLEWALVLGSLSFQAEWSATYINQIGGGPVFLHGCYAFVSYFLTGEHRNYVTKDGAFGPVHVNSPFTAKSGIRNWWAGPGAWEAVLRFAYVDYNDPNIPPVNGLKVGNNMAETTLGMIWYLNDHTRIMMNYVHPIPVDPNFGPSYANAIFLRTAVFW